MDEYLKAEIIKINKIRTLNEVLKPDESVIYRMVSAWNSYFFPQISLMIAVSKKKL